MTAFRWSSDGLKRLLAGMHPATVFDGKMDAKKTDVPLNNKGGRATLLKMKPSKSAQTTVRVRFPSNGETVTHTNYSIQIETAGETAGVEVSINGGEWRPCRESLGLWWFDWSDYLSGGHEVLARVRRPDGSTALSDLRNFMVMLAS